jgi:hypothetical protein
VHGLTIEHILTNATAAAREALARRGHVDYDLLKLDADGPEGSWLRAIDKLITAGNILAARTRETVHATLASLHTRSPKASRAQPTCVTCARYSLAPRPTHHAGSVRINALVVEGSHLHPSRMRRLQATHGYHAYRLDDHDDRRFITARRARAPRTTHTHALSCCARPRACMSALIWARQLCSERSAASRLRVAPRALCDERKSK